MSELNSFMLVPSSAWFWYLSAKVQLAFPVLWGLYKVVCFGKYVLSRLTTKAKLETKYSSLMFKIDPCGIAQVKLGNMLNIRGYSQSCSVVVGSLNKNKR